MVQFDIRQALLFEVFLAIVGDDKLQELAVIVRVVDEDAQ